MSAVFALFLPEAVRLAPWTWVEEVLGDRDTEIVATLPLVLTAEQAMMLHGLTPPNEIRDDAAAFGLDQSIAVLLRARRPDVTPRDRLAALAADAGLPVMTLPDDGGGLLPPSAIEAMSANAADRATDFADLALLRPYVGLRDEPNQADLLMRTLQRILAMLYHDARLAPSEEARLALDAAGRARADVAAVTGVASRETASRNLQTLRPLIEAMPEPDARIFADGPAPSLARLAANRRALRRLALRLADPGSLDPWDADEVIRTLVENDIFLDAWERHRLAILCGFFQS